MKVHIQRAALSAETPFTLVAIKEQARISHDEDDISLALMGWTAAAEIEHLCQIALLTQAVTLTVFAPSQEAGLRLPIGPVADDETPSVTIDGAAFTDFSFAAGLRPYIRWGEAFFDLSPEVMVIEYEAGFGDDETDIPNDLRQVLADQAALFFDSRGASDVRGHTISPHLTRIAARYRGVQA